MPEFSEDYVKKLREENASWRTKCRELETQQHNSVVQVELAKRGIEANPDWVTVTEGQSVVDAVDALVASYPSLQKGEVTQDDPEVFDFTPEEPRVKLTPKPLSPSTPKSNIRKPVRDARITTRNIQEIRKDPKARSKVRDAYRAMLQRGSNQGE